jgi:uncharacterized damage-inducible protein DinB
MIDSVPTGNRGDQRFQRVVNLAAHLSACRENWLAMIEGSGKSIVPWTEERADIASLPDRFRAIEGKWNQFFESLDEDGLQRDFTFEDGGTWTLRTEVQVAQLAFHSAYHRGQIALLVDQLGGEAKDTDYVYWKLDLFA